MAPARLAWLFDVDGTLLLTEGAAREAFACAVRDHLGVADDLQDIGFAGRIEPLILRRHPAQARPQPDARGGGPLLGPRLRPHAPPARARAAAG